MSGFANITGQADGPPTLPPFMLADGVASLNAAYAVMMALYHRDVHGGAGPADRHQPDRAAGPPARELDAELRPTGAGAGPRRATCWDSAPRNTYRTADGRWLAMSGSSPNSRCALFRAIDRADLVDNPDFADPQRRRARRRGRRDRRRLDRPPTLAEAMDVLRAAEVAAAPVYDISDWSPTSTCRPAVFVDVGDDRTRRHDGPGAGAAPGDTRARSSTSVARIGDDNDEVYGDLLGLGADRLDELQPGT